MTCSNDACSCSTARQPDSTNLEDVQIAIAAAVCFSFSPLHGSRSVDCFEVYNSGPVTAIGVA